MLTVYRPFKWFFHGNIFVTNKTDSVLQIELSPINLSEMVQKCIVGPGDTLTLESLTSQSYLTVIGSVPTSSPLSASHKLFKIVGVALVCRRHEYIIEKKHYDYALSMLTK